MRSIECVYAGPKKIKINEQYVDGRYILIGVGCANNGLFIAT